MNLISALRHDREPIQTASSTYLGTVNTLARFISRIEQLPPPPASSSSLVHRRFLQQSKFAQPRCAFLSFLRSSSNDTVEFEITLFAVICSIDLISIVRCILDDRRKVTNAN